MARRQRTRYIGDSAMRRLLERHGCPVPFHVVRLRLFGAIASPSLTASPGRVIESLWPDGPPVSLTRAELNALMQALMGLWNALARHQSGDPPIRLHKLGRLDGREALQAAAELRIGELLDGFLDGFSGGEEEMDVPAGVGKLLEHLEDGVRLYASMRNTCAGPPGPDDATIVAEMIGSFPQVDRAVQADINTVAAATTLWRRAQARAELAR